ncbi:hypothetical protein FACS1894203_5260 [Bacteroidia bacterium]|nr:hypothetical protein FACS1894203_5260 [Bacteroidia bacterium]
MKVLFLPNWKVPVLEKDDDSIQAPDKYIKGEPYWFFRFFPPETEVDIIDFQEKNILHKLEKKVFKTYIWQSILAFRKRKSYDVVISHGAQSGIVFSFLRNFCSKKKPEHYILDIGGMNGARNNWPEISILKLALRSNPYIICHSRIIIENYKNTFKNLVNRSVFIPFGVDTDYFSPFENNSGEKYILSFGTGKRDYDTLFKAWSELNYPDVKLKIIGRTLKKGEQLPPRIELTDKVSIHKLIEEINNSLFVVIPLPVYNYSYGQMSFLQSMSLGKTVVVTKTPSSIDYLTDNRGSFFVEPFDTEDLKAKIRFLLDNPEILSQSNDKARPYILQNFSEKLMGKRIADFIAPNLMQRKSLYLR